MVNFLTQQVNDDVWEKLFSFVVTTTMIVFDLMMEIKIPLTNVSLFYVLIFMMVVELSIYAIHGTSTNYNDLGSTVKSGVSKLYSSTVRKGIDVGKKVYQNSNKQQVKKEVKRQNIREQAKIKRKVK